MKTSCQSCRSLAGPSPIFPSHMHPRAAFCRAASHVWIVCGSEDDARDCACSTRWSRLSAATQPDGLQAPRSQLVRQRAPACRRGSASVPLDHSQLTDEPVAFGENWQTDKLRIDTLERLWTTHANRRLINDLSGTWSCPARSFPCFSGRLREAVLRASGVEPAACPLRANSVPGTAVRQGQSDNCGSGLIWGLPSLALRSSRTAAGPGGGRIPPGPPSACAAGPVARLGWPGME